MLIDIEYFIFDQIEVPDNASSAEIREAIDKNADFPYDNVDWEIREEDEWLLVKIVNT